MVSISTKSPGFVASGRLPEMWNLFHGLRSLVRRARESVLLTEDRLTWIPSLASSWWMTSLQRRCTILFWMILSTMSRRSALGWWCGLLLCVGIFTVRPLALWNTTAPHYGAVRYTNVSCHSSRTRSVTYQKHSLYLNPWHVGFVVYGIPWHCSLTAYEVLRRY